MQQQNQEIFFFIDKAPNEPLSSPAVKALRPHLTTEVQYLYQLTYLLGGTAVAQRLRCCATNLLVDWRPSRKT